MIILIIVGLYTSRILLEILGAEDLGIYSVVASVVLMLEFISSSLINSSQRYISIGLGKNDLELTKRYFSQSVGIHFFLSLIIVILLETVGLWFLNHKLNVPVNRKNAAFWIYQLSIFMAFIKINMICFQSNIISRENMSIYSYLSIFEGVAKLIIVYIIGFDSDIDKLIFYGILLAIVQVIIFLVNLTYCNFNYPESRYTFIWDKKLSKEMFSFASINIFGSFSWAIGVQGINVLLNIFFGPVVNASRGLSSTIGRLITQLVDNVYTAIKPQIIKSYAKGEIKAMITLAEKSTVFIFYMVFIISIPLFLDADFILKIWLKNVPPYTLVYTKLVIIQSLIWMLPIPYSQIATATGKIRNIQMYARIFTLFSLPISYVILHFILNPYYPIIVIILMDCCYWLYTIYTINCQLKINFKRYLSNVIIPIIKVAPGLLIIIIIVSKYINTTGIFHFIIISISSVFVGLFLVYKFGINKDDLIILKQYIIKKIKNDEK